MWYDLNIQQLVGLVRSTLGIYHIYAIGKLGSVFGTYKDQFVMVFIDNVLIYSSSKEEHKQHLTIVFQTLRDHKLHAKFLKSDFGLKEVKFLGHIVSGGVIAVIPAKIEAILAWEPPKMVVEVQNFLAL